MGYRFPDARRGVRALCEPFGTTYGYLTDGWEDHLPAILVYRTGGTEDGVLREDRIQIETYAEGSTAANDLAMEIHEAIVGVPHDVDGIGLLDNIAALVIPDEVPYESDTVTLVTASYRVSTRGL